MLKFFRQNVKLVIWIIVLSFAAWGVGTFTFSKDSASSYIGAVGSEKISYREFLTTLRFFELLTRAQALEKGAPIPYDQLRALVWQEIVTHREATSENIRVSDEEVRNEIQRFFSAAGSFDQGYYEAWVQNNFRGRARDFEETVRRYLMAQKLRDHILKDVPEEERQKRWNEWLISVFQRIRVEDYEEKGRESQ